MDVVDACSNSLHDGQVELRLEGVCAAIRASFGVAIWIAVQDKVLFDRPTEESFVVCSRPVNHANISVREGDVSRRDGN